MKARAERVTATAVTFTLDMVGGHLVPLGPDPATAAPSRYLQRRNRAFKTQP